MKIGHGSNSGIQGFRNSGIEGILSLLIYYSKLGGANDADELMTKLLKDSGLI
jgi:hypothetical protein